MQTPFLLSVYLICVFRLRLTEQQPDLFQSSIDLTEFGSIFQPPNSIDLLGTFINVRSLFQCAMLCNERRQCRTFDYDQSSLVCRLFESDYSTGTVVINSSSLSTRVGAIRFNTTATTYFYSSYNRTCAHCTLGENRYLQCLNNTCMCPTHTYWNGLRCVNKFHQGSNCSSTSNCREDLNLTCSTHTNTCVTVCQVFDLQQPPVLYSTGSGPQSIISNDFNKDDHADLAVTIQGASTVSIFLGIGNGSFQTPVSSYPSNGAAPYWVVSEDFNLDGSFDLAMCNEGANTVSILLGYGNGSFQVPAITFPSGGSLPSAIASADVNHDNRTDLIVANTASATINVFLGNGNGTFQTPGFSYGTGSSPSSLASADFNFDGHTDLAVVSRGSNELGIFLGSANGTFRDNGTYSTGSFPYSVRTADLNGDLKLDLVVANFHSNSINIFLGTGTGRFLPASPATYPTTGASPIDITIEDLNGDSKMDVVTSNQVGDTLTVFLGNGDGTFQTGLNFTSTGDKLQSVIAEDFNKDGKYDLAVTNQNDNTIAILLTQCH